MSLDCIIGFCTYVPTSDGKIAVDVSESYTSETVEKYFRGDYYAYCRKYFAEVACLADNNEINVVADFDLVANFNVDGKYFDETHPKYVMPALVAIERLCAAGKIFEISDCGDRMSPSALLLSSVYELGGKVSLASGCDVERAKAFAKESGFESAYIAVDGKLVPTEL